MFQAEFAAGVAEGVGFVAGAVVGEDAPDGDAKALIPGDRCLEMGDGARGFLIGMYLSEGEPGGVVDADMDKLPAVSLAFRALVGLSGPIARDAMADPLEAAEFLDVEVDHVARGFMFVTSSRLWRIEIAGAGEPCGAQDAADG